MAIGRSRRRTRLAIVVVRSPIDRQAEAIVEESRIQMELQSGDSRQLVIMASADEARATQAARQPTASSRTRASIATETQRRLIAHAHRTRHYLSRWSLSDNLSGARRYDMLNEISRLKEEIQTLQEQVEVTTRSVESMEQLVFHLERLTRDFLSDNPRNRAQAREVQSDTGTTSLRVDTQQAGADV